MMILLFVLLMVSCLAAPLRLSSEVGIHTDAWKTRMEGFTKETGIEVEIQQFPYANYLDQLMLGYTSGRVEIDVPYISMLWYPALSIANYIYPISDIPGYEKINEADIPGIRNAKLNGKTYIIPYMNELGGIIYRKDLFEDPVEKANFLSKYGYELLPPNTLEQYRDIAEFFNRPAESLRSNPDGKKKHISCDSLHAKALGERRSASRHEYASDLQLKSGYRGT
jgi:multiple sugar transport system substrate-binding protein